MNERRRLIGVVTSNKMMKTVVVETSRTFRHPLYRKVVHTSRRVKAQDDLGCQIGDEVQIVESRPLSADKHWVVESIIKKQGVAALADDLAGDVVVDVVEDVAEEATEDVAEDVAEDATEDVTEDAAKDVEDAAKDVAEDTAEGA